MTGRILAAFVLIQTSYEVVGPNKTVNREQNANFVDCVTTKVVFFFIEWIKNVLYHKSMFITFERKKIYGSI